MLEPRHPIVFGGTKVRELKSEYKKGAEARKKFEDGMSKLFRAPKTVTKEPPKEAQPKPQKPPKD